MNCHFTRHPRIRILSGVSKMQWLELGLDYPLPNSMNLRTDFLCSNDLLRTLMSMNNHK